MDIPHDTLVRMARVLQELSYDPHEPICATKCDYYTTSPCDCELKRLYDALTPDDLQHIERLASEAMKGGV